MIDLPEKVREQIARAVAQQPEVRKVFLFGSRARGDAEKRSDIDLAIEAPNIGQRQWLDTSFILKEELDTLLSIDVIRLEDAPAALRERILAEGEVIYERR